MSRRSHLVVLTATLGAVVAAAPARAAPPANDDVAAAAVVTTPFRATVDTADASSEPTDPVCDGPNSRSVWYRLTPAVSGEYAVLTPGFPDFPLDLGVGVYTGRPRALAEIGCNTYRGPNVRWQAQAGTPYLIMIANGQGADFGLGAFEVTIQEVPPPIEVRFGVGDLRLDRATGGVLVPMTVRCSVPAGLLQVQISLTQWRRGQLLVSGHEGETTCPQGSFRHVHFVRPDNGVRFGRWRAHLEIGVAACDRFTCDGRSIDRRVTIF